MTEMKGCGGQVRYEISCSPSLTRWLNDFTVKPSWQVSVFWLQPRASALHLSLLSRDPHSGAASCSYSVALLVLVPLFAFCFMLMLQPSIVNLVLQHSCLILVFCSSCSLTEQLPYHPPSTCCDVLFGLFKIAYWPSVTSSVLFGGSALALYWLSIEDSRDFR